MSASSKDIRSKSDYYRWRGCNLAGIAPHTAEWDWEPFTAGGQVAVSFSGALANANPSVDGGQIGYTTGDGVNAASVAITRTAVNASGVRLVSNAKTSRWYCVGRGKLTTTAGAHTLFGVGHGGTGDCYLGVNATASTTKYTLATGATTLTSTVSINTSMHIFEMWNDTSTLFISVDGEAPVTGAVTNLPAGVAVGALYLSTNAGEAAQTAIWDFWGTLTGVAA